MLEQVQNLDLLYEKETTTKLLEFKLKYLVSYAQLMRNYFLNMVFEDIATELEHQDADPANADLNNLGQKMLLIAALIVQNTEIPQIASHESIEAAHFARAREVISTEKFKVEF